VAPLNHVRETLHQAAVATVRAPAVADTTALQEESLTLHSRAERIVKDAYELWADGQEFRSPVRYGIAIESNRLRQLHESREFRNFARELAGTPMEPTYSAYLYYDVGDFIGLHTDLPACKLTLLVAVAGPCPPLVAHHELRDLSAQQLKELAEASDGAPDGGTNVPVVQGSVVALFGGGLPHQTRPIPVGGASIVGTLCYAGA
jgi:hypothetical protein